MAQAAGPTRVLMEGLQQPDHQDPRHLGIRLVVPRTLTAQPGSKGRVEGELGA